MAPRRPQDGPHMLKKNELQGRGTGKAGVAKHAVKGTLFSLFRRPGGRSEAKMEAKWGEKGPRGDQLEAKMEARRGQLGAKLEPRWPQDGPKMAQERPECANSRGGNKCNKRYPFLTVSASMGLR